MMINKKTQMYLGVAALGVVAYLVYKNNTKKGFANSGSMLNASGRGIFAPTGGVSNSTFRTRPKCKAGEVEFGNCCFPRNSVAPGSTSPSVGTEGHVLTNTNLACVRTYTGAEVPL